MPTNTVQLNADMGESFGAWSMGDDQALIPWIQQANIACGFHASDPQTMMRTVALAQQHKVRIGAHPAYPDLQGFGRRAMALSAAEIEAAVLYQVGALQGICQAQGTTVSYVKPHGALYHAMMTDNTVYQALLAAMVSLQPRPLMVMATPARASFEQQAADYGVPLLFEAFCDRAYTPEGQLQSRQQVGAVYHTLEPIILQAKQLLTEHCVTTCEGTVLKVSADSLCLHGDSPIAAAAAAQIRQLLDSLDDVR